MESKISGHTRLYCLIGSPVGHSGSPAMYNPAFEKIGLDAVYLVFDVTQEKLSDAITAMHVLDVGGFNVTMPCKTAVLDYVDEQTPAVKLIGASNTIVVTDDKKFVAHNTDGIGFMSALKEHGAEVKGSRFVVLGCGGAASAICAQAALDGAAQITMFNPKDAFFANGEKFAKRLNDSVPECKTSILPLEDEAAFATAAEGADILINATRMGMIPDDDVSLVPEDLLRPDLVVGDTVYNPIETKMLREAKAAGCTVVDGTEMLLWQGVAAFKLYTGLDMPMQEIKEKYF